MDLSTVEGFATTLANRMHLTGWDFTTQFNDVPLIDWVEAVPDPKRMRFTVSQTREGGGEVHPVGVYEVSVRKVDG